MEQSYLYPLREITELFTVQSRQYNMISKICMLVGGRTSAFDVVRK